MTAHTTSDGASTSTLMTYSMAPRPSQRAWKLFRTPGVKSHDG
jgi:hypothetical protein